MKLVAFLLLIWALSTSNMLYDFTKDSSDSDWSIVDDVVMGGRSAGDFKINQDGHGVFHGQVSTANNGGFSSVRHALSSVDVLPKNTIAIRLQGDGKDYELRVKAKRNDYHSYVKTFSTTGKWETVEIALSDMRPTFRGRDLDMPNYDSNTLAEITFLIANKRNEDFQLILDKIELLP